jgi:hypothetical protein
MVLREYKGVTYENNKWHLRGIAHGNVAELITFSGVNTKYEVMLTDDDFILLMELKNESESYMNPQGYVDPTSKYYVDRVWEEYHKIKEELAKSKDIIDALKTLVKQIHKDEDRLIQTIETLREPSKEVVSAAFDAWKNAEVGDDAFVLAIRAAVDVAEKEQ